MRLAASVTTASASVFNATEMKPGAMNCRPTWPRVRSTNCGMKARKKAAVLGLVASTRMPSRNARRGPIDVATVSPANAAAVSRRAAWNVRCKQLDLFGRELLAVDGTRIKAVNNKDRNFTRASLTEFIKLADAKLDDYLQRLDRSDASESTTGGSRVKNLAEKIAAIRQRRARCEEMLAHLDRTGEEQISLTDPDSRAMAAHTRVAVGYNVQVAVDTKHKLIVEQQVTNQVVDMGLLTQTAAPAKEVLGVETIAVVADRGYFKIEDIEACEQAGIEPYVPRPQRGPSVKAGLFRKDEFQYDADSDSYVCPAGQRLYPYSSSLLRGLKKINYTNKLACDDCKIRSQCTNGRFRTVSRLENEAVLDRMQARLAQRPSVLDRRREAVEHPFGSIKQWMNQGAFLMRGLEKVRAEFSLTALAYNLRRVLNLVGFTELMAALAA